jgi:hypothetical protein
MSPEIVDEETQVLVPIESLVIGDSPRLAGINADHVRVLAEMGENLPPILVHRPTMRVIDGAHRVRAALSRGAKTISARYFDGDDATAFVLAVEANVGHGLPLTLAERTAAAARIVRAYPHWSDRRIAAVAGLSPKTVGAIRVSASEEIPQPRYRIGLDGRARRVAPRTRPEQDDAGPDDVVGLVPHQRNATSRTASAAGQTQTVQVLRKDPSLRFTENGRTLLRLLDLHFIDVGDWERIVASVPAHCAGMVADLARDCAEAWLVFADCLKDKSA